jgi:hypothetical protein
MGPIRSMVAYGFRFREVRLVGVWIVASAAAVALLPDPLRALPHAAIGGGSWFVLEYGVHRFVLHARGPIRRVLERLGLDVHWQHHLDPTDPRLVFTPWWATGLLMAGTAAFGSLTEGRTSAAGAVLGMRLVFLHYELTHLSAHVPYVHRTRYGRFMKRFHLLHHVRNERYWFGVTHPLGDAIAGTWPRTAAVDRSPTVRTLGVDAHQ